MERKVRLHIFKRYTSPHFDIEVKAVSFGVGRLAEWQPLKSASTELQINALP